MSNSARDPGSRPVPTGSRRPPESLERQVCDALKADGYVNASAIHVKVSADSGDVTLTGTVPTEDQQRQAEKCAASIQGVASVRNRLEIDGDTGGSGDGSREFGKDKESARRPATTIGVQPKPK
jgi:osmotically-inducible protein OsmY